MCFVVTSEAREWSCGESDELSISEYETPEQLRARRACDDSPGVKRSRTLVKLLRRRAQRLAQARRQFVGLIQRGQAGEVRTNHSQRFLVFQRRQVRNRLCQHGRQVLRDGFTVC